MCREIDDQEETDQEHAEYLAGRLKISQGFWPEEEEKNARELEQENEMRWGGFHE